MIINTSYDVPIVAFPQRMAGLGLFDTGLDTSGWGFPEWAIVIGGGAYIAYSVLTTGKRHVSGVKACIRACRGG